MTCFFRRVPPNQRIALKLQDADDQRDAFESAARRYQISPGYRRVSFKRLSGIGCWSPVESTTRALEAGRATTPGRPADGPRPLHACERVRSASLPRRPAAR
jgi:hypothetical protein